MSISFAVCFCGYIFVVFLFVYLCVCQCLGERKRQPLLACSLLQPTLLFYALGSYIAVTCGSLSGNFYLSRLLESNQSTFWSAANGFFRV